MNEQYRRPMFKYRRVRKKGRHALAPHYTQKNNFCWMGSAWPTIDKNRTWNVIFPDQGLSCLQFTRFSLHKGHCNISGSLWRILPVAILNNFFQFSERHRSVRRSWIWWIQEWAVEVSGQISPLFAPVASSCNPELISHDPIFNMSDTFIGVQSDGGLGATLPVNNTSTWDGHLWGLF